MITLENLAELFKLLEKHYTKERMYKDRTKEDVLFTWENMFRDADPVEVISAAKMHIAVSPYPPQISDITNNIVKIRKAKQMTGMEAFHEIKRAVNDGWTGKEAYADAFNNLPPILRRVAGSGKQLRDWAQLDPVQFETVIMPFIVKSYNTLAEREAMYFALPADMQKSQSWILDGPPDEVPPALPEKTIEDIYGEQVYAEIRKDAAEKKEKYKEAVEKFQRPLSAEDIKRYEKLCGKGKEEKPHCYWDEESISSVSEKIKERILNHESEM